MNVDCTIIKNAAVCRKELDRILNGNFKVGHYEWCNTLQFFRIYGISKFWEKEFSSRALIGDILNGIVRQGIPFVYVIEGDEEGIAVYVGTAKVLEDSLQTAYEATFPEINIEQVQKNPLKDNVCNYGGFFTGIPTDKSGEEKRIFAVENVCRAMLGHKFVYVLLASGISNIVMNLAHEKILEEMQEIFPFINRTVTGGVQGNLSAQKQDFQIKNYFENLERLEQNIKEGIVRGSWFVNGYYAAENQMNARKLGNIIKAGFSGEMSCPEPFRVLEYNDIKEVICCTQIMKDEYENTSIHPVGRWHREGFLQDIFLYVYKYQTVLTSEQLATLCQLPICEFPGYALEDYVEFEVSDRRLEDRQEPIELGSICVAGQKKSPIITNPYYVEKDDLTRHALIVGMTGGGKTNTSKSILNVLWNGQNQQRQIPFLVIESAKREYWELRNLKGFEELLVFTLGSENEQTSVKYRINPFQTMKGISLQTHIDYLLSTFKAAFDLYPPMPYVLERAVYEVYNDRGWDIVENVNRYGLTEYPTISDLYHKIDVVVDSMGYYAEIQSNVKAALKARISSLMIGGKGAMLDTAISFPIEELLARPVVMELEDLGDDETKAFVIGILLVQLYEYRKAQMTKGSKRLTHILLVEEAHRLLKNVSEAGEGGNARAKSVEFFCNLLAEIRTYGQGIFIADQIPTKLASDTLKNTNLKIVHRIVAQEDRETIGKSMNMTSEQIAYLSSLKRGYAAVYAEGDTKPKCVKFPRIEPIYEKERAEVILEVKEKVCQIAAQYTQTVKFHMGCRYCERRCQYFSDVKNYIEERIETERVLADWEKEGYCPESITKFIHSRVLQDLGMKERFKDICAIGFILNQEDALREGERLKILANYLNYEYS